MSEAQENQGLVEEPAAAIYAAENESNENDDAVTAEAGEEPEQG